MVYMLQALQRLHACAIWWIYTQKTHVKRTLTHSLNYMQDGVFNVDKFPLLL